MAGQPGFFDSEERLKALSAVGDPLERLSQVVDFEVFRGALETALSRSDRSKGGRPPYDAVLMFKVLVLQTLYTLSDEQTEYQLKDRLSFMRFIGLALHDAVPDAKTIWLYREQLARAGAVERLFARFDELLRAKGWLAMGGQIVDATIIRARRPRLTKTEKDTIKGGGTPAEWKPARRAQIDRDGRWTLKRGRKRETPANQAPGQAPGGHQRQPEIAVPMFGYKNHIGVDREHGFLRRYVVTHAARYDGSQLGAVLDPDNTASDVWADTAYRSAANLALLERRGLKPQFQRKKPRGRRMPAHIARGNATRARVRARVEHVFAAQKCRLGLVVRTVGMVRARAKIGMANLVYNFTRLAWLKGQTAPA
jgi:transposase, IS5 family